MLIDLVLQLEKLKMPVYSHTKNQAMAAAFQKLACDNVGDVYYFEPKK
jgi:hypothetical protein